MIDFIVNNWKFLALALAAIVDVVLIIISKKKVNPSIDEVLVNIPDWIRFAEEKYGAGHGDAKKLYVLHLCKSLYKHLTGIEVVEGSHLFKVFSATIENVLKTPQKKGK